MNDLPGTFARSVVLRLLITGILYASVMSQIEAKATKMLDLADTVNSNRIMIKLAIILQSSDMVTFLSSKGPFTLFAPTDAAFAKLTPGTLDALLRPENKERLQHILLLHVVSGKKLFAKDLLTTTDLTSCEGAPLPLKTTKSGAQFVLKAKIIHADIRCLNGVIHEIDTVLMPPESSLPPLAPPSPPAPKALPASTNAVANPSTDTNTAPVTSSDSSPTGATTMAPEATSTETNSAPVAPVTTPDVSPH